MIGSPSGVWPTAGGGAVPTLFAGLVDDAGLFPPEELPLAAALARHRGDESAGSFVLSHRFVCPAARLEELQGELAGSDRIKLSLITCLDGPAIEKMLLAVADDSRLTLASVEAALPLDWAQATNDVTAAIELIPDGVPVFLEVPVQGDVAPALDFASANGWAAKARCGGVQPNLFPTNDQLSAFIVQAVDLGVPFKATAGLHHAVRYRDPITGFSHHGFLNILLATARANAGRPDISDALSSTDTAALAAEARELDERAATHARSMFISYGSCSTSDPIDDLTGLRLIPAAVGD